MAEKVKFRGPTPVERVTFLKELDFQGKSSLADHGFKTAVGLIKPISLAAALADTFSTTKRIFDEAHQNKLAAPTDYLRLLGNTTVLGHVGKDLFNRLIRR